MTLAIITHADHLHHHGSWFAYGPYVKEINLWVQHVEKVCIVAPVRDAEPGAIELEYKHEFIEFYKIPAISLTSFGDSLRALVYAPLICYRIWKAMRKADHIHLRCPGNIGLLGCLIQVLFPWKQKTAKYAGNWDPASKQPISYRFQKWLLANTLLTRNMQVLVYGEWPGQSKNIKPFFTATYSEKKIPNGMNKEFTEPYTFVFVGSLAAGKRPLYAVELIGRLREAGYNCTLDMYGEGAERANLTAYIGENELTDVVKLHGNIRSEELENVYRQSHFLVLPSKSEGWPKVVAEAMFWECVPVVTPISCVPWMLDFGKRGILISADLERDIEQLNAALQRPDLLVKMSKLASQWSKSYTLESFENELRKLL